MKKLLLVLVLATAFVSCEKDEPCDCVKVWYDTFDVQTTIEPTIADDCENQGSYPDNIINNPTGSRDKAGYVVLCH